MPKEKNKALNPYYLELLKYLVVYKFKNRLGLELSIEERDELASELNEYNTKDSLSRIFSQGGKRRQNFNKSNLQGLCNYVGYVDWEQFIEKEYQSWADELEEILYADLDSHALKKINKTIFIRILQEIESKIIEGITEYFKTYILKENKQIGELELEDKLQSTIRVFNLCIDFIAKNTDEAHLMVVYKIAENIDEGRHLFNGFKLPDIFTGELFNKIRNKESLSIIDELVDEVENPLNKEVMRLYKEGYNDENILLFLNHQGVEIKIEEIKLIRWKTADRIFNQLKKKEDGRKLFQD